jgi:prolyl oligopeptidase PreP (S9A serine peptidase family)
MVFFKDLEAENSQVVELINVFEAQYNFIDNDGPLFWFQTDLNAPRGRLIAVDINNPDPSNWKEVIPQMRETLRGVNLVGNLFVATYLKDARTQVKMFDVNGHFVREVAFPGLGTAYGAMVGGFVVGVAVEMSTLVFPNELKAAVGLAVLIVMLLIKPQGLLGSKERIG